MSTSTVRFLPQTQLTLRATSILQLADVLDVSRFDQVIVELVLMSPPTLAVDTVKLHTKTANEIIANVGFDAYDTKTLTNTRGTTAGTPAVFRGAVWQREYRQDNQEPLLGLLAFSLENASASAITLDVQINVIGTGCSCGK
ncbi:MAG: hypothetical protein FJ100_07445 [Deltaproteobacteria bacterium]|nr:hypothetical protein [Deltaproteobacteria bacterium]